jgi:hypothetical protein
MIFSIVSTVHALQEYQRQTPGFDWREYLYVDTGSEIKRTDPTMIDIVRRIGSKQASASGCWIIIEFVPWDLRNHFSIEDDDDGYTEFIDIQVKTLRRTRN